MAVGEFAQEAVEAARLGDGGVVGGDEHEGDRMPGEELLEPVAVVPFDGVMQGGQRRRHAGELGGDLSGQDPGAGREGVQPAVVAQLHHVVAAGVGPSDPDHRRQRLAARLEETRRLRAGHERAEQLGRGRLQRVRMTEQDAVRQLRCDRGVHGGVPVAEAHGAQRAAVVDELAPPVVPDPAPAPAGDDLRLVRQQRRRLGVRAGADGHHRQSALPPGHSAFRAVSPRSSGRSVMAGTGIWASP